MAALANDVIHPPLRLRTLLEASDRNLSAHLATLEEAGYIAFEKDFLDRQPRTRVAITRPGRTAFEQHVACLRDVPEGGTRAS